MMLTMLQLLRQMILETRAALLSLFARSKTLAMEALHLLLSMLLSMLEEYYYFRYGGSLSSSASSFSRSISISSQIHQCTVVAALSCLFLCCFISLLWRWLPPTKDTAAKTKTPATATTKNDTTDNAANQIKAVWRKYHQQQQQQQQKQQQQHHEEEMKLIVSYQRRLDYASTVIQSRMRGILVRSILSGRGLASLARAVVQEEDFAALIRATCTSGNNSRAAATLLTNEADPSESSVKMGMMIDHCLLHTNNIHKDCQNLIAVFHHSVATNYEEQSMEAGVTSSITIPVNTGHVHVVNNNNISNNKNNNDSEFGAKVKAVMELRMRLLATIVLQSWFRMIKCRRAYRRIFSSLNTAPITNLLPSLGVGQQLLPLIPADHHHQQQPGPPSSELQNNNQLQQPDTTPEAISFISSLSSWSSTWNRRPNHVNIDVIPTNTTVTVTATATGSRSRSRTTLTTAAANNNNTTVKEGAAGRSYDPFAFKASPEEKQALRSSITYYASIIQLQTWWRASLALRAQERTQEATINQQQTNKIMLEQYQKEQEMTKTNGITSNDDVSEQEEDNDDDGIRASSSTTITSNNDKKDHKHKQKRQQQQPHNKRTTSTTPRRRRRRNRNNDDDDDDDEDNNFYSELLTSTLQRVVECQNNMCRALEVDTSTSAMMYCHNDSINMTTTTTTVDDDNNNNSSSTENSESDDDDEDDDRYEIILTSITGEGADAPGCGLPSLCVKPPRSKSKTTRRGGGNWYKDRLTSASAATTVTTTSATTDAATNTTKSRRKVPKTADNRKMSSTTSKSSRGKKHSSGDTNNIGYNGPSLCYGPTVPTVETEPGLPSNTAIRTNPKSPVVTTCSTNPSSLHAFSTFSSTFRSTQTTNDEDDDESDAETGSANHHRQGGAGDEGGRTTSRINFPFCAAPVATSMTSTSSTSTRSSGVTTRSSKTDGTSRSSSGGSYYSIDDYDLEDDHNKNNNKGGSTTSGTGSGTTTGFEYNYAACRGGLAHQQRNGKIANGDDKDNDDDDDDDYADEVPFHSCVI